MESSFVQYDVCVICALPEEVRAFLDRMQPLRKGAIKECFSTLYGYTYRSAVIKNHNEEPLRLHISWPPRYGQQEMILHLSNVLKEYQPRLVLMTGICAGDSQRVQLGDLVVAERTYTYDNGKFTLDEYGRSVHEHDTLTYQLDANLLGFLGLFDAWKPFVARLKRPSSSFGQHKRRKVVCHLKPIASGNAVRADHPFEDVRIPVRGTVAIDMEGAAFGLVMSRHPLVPWLIVKGVCDYADGDKNDIYHDYAAQASALYALSFIQTYVTNERLPRKASSGEVPPELGPSSPRQKQADPPDDQQKLRTHLLGQVKAIWIEGILEPTLHGVVNFTPRLENRGDSVHKDLPSQAPRALPEGTTILQVYENGNGDLLIIGDPGTGKTTLLLELTHTLLDRAHQNQRLPIPVVFNLRSWKKQYRSLNDWLARELSRIYRVSLKDGQSLIDTHQVLPLLDGLDELAKDERIACVKQINTYCKSQQGSKKRSVVVCCGTNEYDEITTRVHARRRSGDADDDYLHLQDAVGVVSPTIAQMNTSLEEAEQQVKGIKQALSENDELRKLARQPLMLNIVTRMCQDPAAVKKLSTKTTQELQKVFLTEYIEVSIHNKKIELEDGKPETIKSYLIFLAQRMRDFKYEYFFVEDVRPDWLSSHKFTLIYRMSTVLGVGLMVGMVVGLVVGLKFGLTLGLIAGLISGLCLGWGIGMEIGKDDRIERHKILPAFHAKVSKRYSIERKRGESFSLYLKKVLKKNIRRCGEAALWLGNALFQFIVWFVTGLFWLINQLLAQLKALVDPTKRTWQWSQARSPLWLGLSPLWWGFIIGLISGLALALFLGLSDGLIDGFPINPFIAVVTALVLGLGGVLIAGIVGGFKRTQPVEDSSSSPSRYIQAAINGLVLGLAGALTIALTVAGTGGDWIIGLAFAIVGGLIAALIFGLDAYVQHFLVLFLLSREGRIPKNLTSFLDKMVKWRLLHKQGKRYEFQPPQLLDCLVNPEHNEP